MTSLEYQILATVVYYDMFDYPLSLLDIYTKLISKQALKEFLPDFKFSGPEVYSTRPVDILEALESSNLKRYISSKNGFYFLKERKNLVKKRIGRNKISIKKWKKLKRLVKLFSLNPFIKAINTTGSLVLDNAKKTSDLDVFIITQRNHVWSARSLLILLVYLLGLKRHEGKNVNNTDKICPGHFVTKDNLKIPRENLALAYWFSSIIPVFDPENLFQKYTIKNRWVKKYLAHPLFSKNNLHQIKCGPIFRMLRSINIILLDNAFGDALESLVRKFLTPTQFKKAWRVVDKKEKDKVWVNISKNQIVLHTHAKDVSILDNFSKRLRKYVQS